MATGTIGKWLVNVGDKVGPGDAMAEIETDKASMAFEAQDEFYVAKLIIDVGKEVPFSSQLLVSSRRHLFFFIPYRCLLDHLS